MMAASGASSAIARLSRAYERVGSVSSRAHPPAINANASVTTIAPSPTAVRRITNIDAVTAPPATSKAPIAYIAGRAAITYGVRNCGAAIAATITPAPNRASIGPASRSIRESGGRSLTRESAAGHAHDTSPSAISTASGGTAGRMYGISFALAHEKATTVTAAAVMQKLRAGLRGAARQVRNGTSNDHGSSPIASTGT